MTDEKLPVIIYVKDNDDKIIDVIYGQEKRDILQVDMIIFSVYTDPNTNKKQITRKYKITKVNIEKNEININELKVDCIIIG